MQDDKSDQPQLTKALSHLQMIKRNKTVMHLILQLKYFYIKNPQIQSTDQFHNRTW